jgi:hypothetical protein
MPLIHEAHTKTTRRTYNLSIVLNVLINGVAARERRAIVGVASVGRVFSDGRHRPRMVNISVVLKD